MGMFYRAVLNGSAAGQDIKNILDMMAKQDHQRDMAQIGVGEVSRVPEIIQ